MLTFNDFRNAATDIWRDDDIARHVDKVPLPIPHGARLVLFPSDLYAVVEQTPNDAVARFTSMGGKTMFTRVSRTQIARVLYALEYVHRSGDLPGLLNEAITRRSCEGAFNIMVEAFGAVEIDEELLRLTIRTHTPQWTSIDADGRRQAICNWMIDEFRGWAKTPKTEAI